MVQRYESGLFDRGDGQKDYDIFLSDNGQLVLYDDYAALEAELNNIDELLARRPALDDCQTRYDKISKAISTAKQKDALEARVKELESENAKLRADAPVGEG